MLISRAVFGEIKQLVGRFRDSWTATSFDNNREYRQVYLASDTTQTKPHQELMTPAKESIDIIEEQTAYISKIVNDLQDFARPLKPEIKEVDLSKMIASIF